MAVLPRGKQKHQTESRDEIPITLDEEEDDDIDIIGSKRQLELGSMDKYASNIDPDASIESRMTMRQQTMMLFLKTKPWKCSIF